MNLTSFCPATPPFVTLINTLFTSQCLLSPINLFPSDYGPQLKDGDEFDFIIVGAGSAGSVVASRLSENPNWKILLLEAGGYPSTMSEIPAMYPFLYGSEEDWGYKTEPIPGLQNRTNFCPRGKALGGTSTINAMIYLRGNRHDYDGWAAKGNSDWDYNYVRNYFNRGGEIKISRKEDDQPTLRLVMEQSYTEMGFGKFDEETGIGVKDVWSTIWEGRRYSSGKAFLSKAKDRVNLHVVLKAQVGKLLVDDSLKVSGVEVRLGNTLLKIKTKNEVILSAGAVNSPQILMNSGIGPQDHLQQMGIPVLKNLKVGQNMQDHPLSSPVVYNVDESILTPKGDLAIIDELYQYFMHRKGAMTQTGVDSEHLFANTNPNSTLPSVQIYYLIMYKNDIYGAANVLKLGLDYSDEAIDILKDISKKNHSILFFPGISYQESRGKILLRSSDPFDPPKIFNNLLGDPRDIRTVLDGTRLCQKIGKTKAFAPYAPKMVHFPLSNCTHLEPDSDDYWECLARNLATTTHHLVGTCKMGPASDPDAVVDEMLLVHGTKGLRVVDASIMPKIVSCNLNGPTMMIGEKGAAMIKEAWM